MLIAEKHDLKIRIFLGHKMNNKNILILRPFPPLKPQVAFQEKERGEGRGSGEEEKDF